MSEENKNERHRGLFMVMAVAIAVPLLYVLSAGPACAICQRFPNPKLHSAVQEIYYPLTWLNDHTALQKPLQWYCGLWYE